MPLILDVHARAYKAVDFLLEYDGLRASLCNAHGKTALSMAIAQGSVLILQQLLRRGDVEFYSQDPRFQRPLLVALESRHHKSFEILLRDSRTNVNMKVSFAEQSCIWLWNITILSRLQGL